MKLLNFKQLGVGKQNCGFQQKWSWYPKPPSESERLDICMCIMHYCPQSSNWASFFCKLPTDHFPYWIMLRRDVQFKKVTRLRRLKDLNSRQLVSLKPIRFTLGFDFDFGFNFKVFLFQQHLIILLHFINLFCHFQVSSHFRFIMTSVVLVKSVQFQFN